MIKKIERKCTTMDTRDTIHYDANADSSFESTLVGVLVMEAAVALDSRTSAV